MTIYVLITLALMVWGYLPGHLCRAQRRETRRMFRIILLPCAVGFAWHSCSSPISLVGSIGYLASRHAHAGRAQKFDAWALAGAEVGVVFYTVDPDTGPIWGRRAWGMWWTWDARLTTTLVLWLIYVSYLLLRRFAAGPQMQTVAAVLGHLRRSRYSDRVFLHAFPESGPPSTPRQSLAGGPTRGWPPRCWVRSCGTCWRGLHGEC